MDPTEIEKAMERVVRETKISITRIAYSFTGKPGGFPGCHLGDDIIRSGKN
jgi:hypothetical protein